MMGELLRMIKLSGLATFRSASNTGADRDPLQVALAHPCPQSGVFRQVSSEGSVMPMAPSRFGVGPVWARDSDVN
jgi:hypothetical protein